MSDWQIQRRIKYESELDLDFCSQIKSTPGAEHLSKCIQCGTCSSTCPLSIYMDYTPRRIVAMTRAGFKHDVLSSLTIWLCSSCYACSVECPKQINITNIMYALKRRAIIEGIYPKRFGIPVLAREFYNVVRKNGRNNEGKVILKLVLKTGLFSHMKKAIMGIKLVAKGRLSITADKITNRKQFRTILEASKNYSKKDSKNLEASA